jgi:Tol biopolymer transport system component
MKNVLRIFMVVMFVVVTSTVLFSGIANAEQLTNNDYDDLFPRMNDNGGYVVWYGAEGGDDYEIFLYDGTTTTRLTDDSVDDRSVYVNDAGDVVWSRGLTDIYLYDGTFPIKNISPDSNWNYHKAINNAGYVVWDSSVDNEDENREIYLYNGTETIQFTDNGVEDIRPDINDSGDIVWAQFDGNDLEIMLYDAGTTSTTQLTDNDYDDEIPRINDTGDVVWFARDGGAESDYEIFLYTGTLPAAQLTDNDYDDWYYEINNAGVVVWQGWVTESNAEVFLYDGTLPAQRITDNDINDRYPKLNDDGVVVWYGEGEDAIGEIYGYDGTTVRQLTDNSYDDENPKISNDGTIAWYGAVDGDDYEIFIYNYQKDEDDDDDGLCFINTVSK